MPPSTLVLRRITIPMPAVARPSSTLISTSTLIEPSNSFMYGGGIIRIQLTIAAK
nr:hypothetical protein [Pseudomonas antarctica]